MSDQTKSEEVIELIAPTNTSVDAEEIVEKLEISKITGQKNADSEATGGDSGEELSRPETAFPMCSSPPEKTSADQGNEGKPSKAHGAFVNRAKIWEEKVLRVYFMEGGIDPQTGKYDDEYSCIDGWERGHSKERLGKGTIMDWATVWNFAGEYPNLPVFEMTDRKGEAHIRVKLSDGGENWSLVGTDALTEVNEGEPTMCLSLKGHNTTVQRSLVIHEFGHAMGLEHEHQRSDFWEVLNKYFDQDKMMKDPRLSLYKTEKEKKAAFGRDWLPKEGVDKQSRSEYDPESIMHYRFEIKWIREEKYRKLENIADLPEPDKTYLMGLFARSKRGQLQIRPSQKDREQLQKAYANGNYLSQD